MPQVDPKSFSGQEKQQTVQTVPYPQHFEDDTIDLYELSLTLWKRRWLVIAVTVVAALGSLVYALQMQRIYKAEALLLPPKAKDFQSLNHIGIGIYSSMQARGITNKSQLTSKDVFSKFTQNLNSRILQKKFIKENGLMELLAPERTQETIDEIVYQGFAELIELEEEDEITSLSIELGDPEIAAQWINDLIEFVDKETIAMLVEDKENSIENQIKEIEYEIGSKRQMAKQRRLDQMVRYKEAADVANNLGIKRRVDATNIIQNTQMNVDIATATTPLYYLGFEALMTEIEILVTRKSDDPFISGLRDLQEKLALLREIKFDKENMSTIRVDQAAYPPNNPIKPKKRLIFSFATVVGLFSGIFLAFFVEFLQNQKKKHSK